MINSKEMEFYLQLPLIQDFANIARTNQYLEIPADWSIVISDIQGSTKAIEEGRYKEVNLIGVATISAIQNELQFRDFPFVFGGDGATLLIPNTWVHRIRQPLERLILLSQKQFQLNLRIGIVPYTEVQNQKGKILLGRYKLSPNLSLASFQGGGLQIAEKLVKGPNSKYLIQPPQTATAPNLESLSCRWAPLKSRNGQIASTIVQVRDPARAEEIYTSILREIHPIFNSETERPVSAQQMTGERFWMSFLRERRLRQDLNFLECFTKILIPMTIARFLRSTKWMTQKSGFINYLNDTGKNSDYKKMDETLRLVLDCNSDQLDKLQKVLKFHYDGDEIYYGIHLSDSALITCVVESLSPEGHLHFIDGNHGGYAMAAKAMKKQIKGLI